MPGFTLGERLKEARTDRGLTRMALEQLAKVSKGYVTHIEKGTRTRISAEQASKLAEALRVNAQWLTAGIGPRDAEGGSEADPVMRQLETWARANMPGNGVTEEVLSAFVAEHRFAGGAGMTLDDLYADLLSEVRRAKRGRLRVVVDEEADLRRELAAGGATDEEIEQEIAQRRQSH